MNIRFGWLNEADNVKKKKNGMAIDGKWINIYRNVCWVVFTVGNSS